MPQLKDNKIVIPDRITTVKRTGLALLICEGGLGYCCPWLFFSLNRNVSAELLAARFGVAERTIRTWRGKFRDGELKCEGSINCMKNRLKRRK